MIIVADIGATKTVIAEASIKNKKINLDKTALFLGADFASFEKVLEKYAADKKIKPKGQICIGVAGAVLNNTCQVTNLPWTVDGKALANEYGFERVILLNDLEASAYGLESIPAESRIIVNMGESNEKGNRVLLSPGTGLGEAIIHNIEGRSVPIASEGGHADFAPIDGTSKRMWEYLKRTKNNICYEDFLSGRGIGNIFNFLMNEDGVEPDEALAEELKSDSGIAVTTLALDGSNGPAVAAVNIFFDILASEAGNLALKCLATGGVFIGGGITPRLTGLLDKARFIEVFSNKSKHRKLLETIPINIITDTQLPLYGAAAYLLANYG